MSRPLKIAIIGPQKCGKTKLTSIITDSFVNIDQDYVPTVGVRIIPHVHSQDVDTPVITEIWDCSGDQSYESCWKAILDDLQGIIVCFNPESKRQEEEARIWCEWFATQGGLIKGQVAMFAITEDKTIKHKPMSIYNGQCTVPIANVSTNDSKTGIPIVKRLFGKVLGGIHKARVAKGLDNNTEE